MASCSSSLERDVQEFGGGLSMLEALGDRTEGRSVDARHGLVPISSVAHDPGEIWDFGQPPAITLALKLS